MGKSLVFSTSAELFRVSPEAVVFISADGNYSVIHLADGAEYVLTMQLGHVERRIAETLNAGSSSFIRIGKSLIVNREYISTIHVARQKLGLSDCRTFRHELQASREALKALKELIEKEEAI